MKLIETFSDYNMLSDKKAINKHNYIRYRLGRLKHNLWLKTRKSKDKVYIDSYDNFIIQNLKPGNTCYFGSAGYYVEDLVSNLTVIEQWPVVKAFYPSAVIIENRTEISDQFPNYFDNFVVVNNRGDHWANGLESIKEYFDSYTKSLRIGGLIFYSFRDTQIPNWNRLKINHRDYFYNFAKDLEQTYNLNLLWHDIKFANKEKDGEGNYDILENPDTTNGNIKFIFQLKNNDHKLDLTHYVNG